MFEAGLGELLAHSVEGYRGRSDPDLDVPWRLVGLVELAAVRERERVAVVDPGDDCGGLEGPPCERELRSLVQPDRVAGGIEHGGQEGHGVLLHPFHPLVVAGAADNLEGLAEGSAALDDRLAAVAGDGLADSLAGVAELPQPLSVDMLIGQRPGRAAEQAVAL